jgi:pre-mRNA-splicing factor SYF1
MAVDLKTLTATFPLTLPIPTPITHTDLIGLNDLHREEDLLRNPSSFRSWWSAINTTRETLAALQKNQTPAAHVDVTRLLGPLATPHARISLQRLTFLYEAALVHFPNSFKLWKAYLQMRMSFVLGTPSVKNKKRAGGRKKFPEMKEALEEEREEIDEMERWEGGLDGIVAWEEWKALVATFERALMWLPNVRSNPNIILIPSHPP